MTLSGASTTASVFVCMLIRYMSCTRHITHPRRRLARSWICDAVVSYVVSLQWEKHREHFSIEIKRDNWTHILALQHYLLLSFLMYWNDIHAHAHAHSTYMRKNVCIVHERSIRKMENYRTKERNSFWNGKIWQNTLFSLVRLFCIFIALFHSAEIKNYSMFLDFKAQKNPNIILWHREEEENKKATNNRNVRYKECDRKTLAFFYWEKDRYYRLVSCY